MELHSAGLKTLTTRFNQTGSCCARLSFSNGLRKHDLVEGLPPFSVRMISTEFLLFFFLDTWSFLPTSAAAPPPPIGRTATVPSAAVKSLSVGPRFLPAMVFNLTHSAHSCLSAFTANYSIDPSTKSFVAPSVRTAHLELHLS